MKIEITGNDNFEQGMGDESPPQQARRIFWQPNQSCVTTYSRISSGFDIRPLPVFLDAMEPTLVHITAMNHKITAMIRLDNRQDPQYNRHDPQDNRHDPPR